MGLSELKGFKVDGKLRLRHARKEANAPSTKRGNVGSFSVLFHLAHNPPEALFGEVSLFGHFIRKELYPLKKFFLGVMVGQKFDESNFGW
jgi:hypothetical protein